MLFLSQTLISLLQPLRGMSKPLSRTIISPVRQLSRNLISPVRVNSVGMGKPLSRALISHGKTCKPLFLGSKHLERSPLYFRLEKMGFLTYSLLSEDGELLIFAVDLGGGGGHYTTELLPAVRIEGFGSARNLSAMCVSNSTLYIFEGRDNRRDLELEKGGRSVWKLDLSSEIMGKVEHEMVLDELDRVSDMHQPKCHPLAFPISISTADGDKINKILVLCYVFNNCDPIDAMELYDPSEDSWEVLPKFPIETPFYTFFELVETHSCNPLGDSGLMVHTNKGTFVMDLNSVNKAWKRTGAGLSGDQRKDFALIKDQYLITPWWLRDLKGVDVWPKLSSLDYSVQTDDDDYGMMRGGHDQPRMFLVEGDSAACCHYLVSRTQLLPYELHRLLIDVCHVDFSPLRNTVVRTLRFGFDAASIFYLRHALFRI